MFRWRLVSKCGKFVDLTPIGSAIRFLQRWTNPQIVYVNLRHSWLMFIDISCIFRRVVINNPTFSEKSSWAYRSKAREFIFETAYTSFRKANRWLLYVFFFFHQRNTWEMLFSGLTSELNNLIVARINFLKRYCSCIWTMMHLMLFPVHRWKFPLPLW